MIMKSYCSRAARMSLFIFSETIISAASPEKSLFGSSRRCFAPSGEGRPETLPVSRRAQRQSSSFGVMSKSFESPGLPLVSQFPSISKTLLPAYESMTARFAAVIVLPSPSATLAISRVFCPFLFKRYSTRVRSRRKVSA